MKRYYYHSTTSRPMPAAAVVIAVVLMFAVGKATSFILNRQSSPPIPNSAIIAKNYRYLLPLYCGDSRRTPEDVTRRQQLLLQRRRGCIGYRTCSTTTTTTITTLKSRVEDEDEDGGNGNGCSSKRKRVLATVREFVSRRVLRRRRDGDGSGGGGQQIAVARRRRKRRLVTIIPPSVLLAMYLVFRQPLPANAKFSYEISESPTYSLRPGMTSEDAELAEAGDADAVQNNKGFQASDDNAAESTGTGDSASSSSTVNKGKAKQGKKKKASESLYYDDDEDEFDVEEFDERVTVGSAQDQIVAKRLQSQTAAQFASNYKGKSTFLTVKVALGLFVPTFGGMFVREFLRRGREEEYVKKGLEILDAQKAEYFNVTESTSDSDVEDELKGLKKNETSTDDDDDDDGDDDDDDNNDDEDDDDSPKRPKRGGGPRGGGGGGDDDGTGGGSDPGYGSGPSDEDLDKLNKIFGKS